MLNVFVKILRFDVLCEKKFFFRILQKKIPGFCFILLFYSKKNDSHGKNNMETKTEIGIK